MVVIGGGDTGADCVGNSIREGAASVTQLELLPEPPDHRPDDRTPWPLWPLKYRMSYAMEEATRSSAASRTTRSSRPASWATDGRVRAALHWREADAGAAVRAASRAPSASCQADLVLLAMGFLHPQHEGVVEQLGVDRDRAAT